MKKNLTNNYFCLISGGTSGIGTSFNLIAIFKLFIV